MADEQIQWHRSPSLPSPPKRDRFFSGAFTEPVRGGTDGGSHPFKAIPTGDTAFPVPNPIIVFEPGRVVGIVPTLGGIPLSQVPRPSMPAPDDDLSIFLRIHIDTTNVDNNKRAGVDAVTVLTDNDVGEDLTGPELEEGKMFWEEDGTEKGHFYVKICDIDIGDPTPPSLTPIVSVALQAIISNIGTIVIAGDEAIILCTL